MLINKQTYKACKEKGKTGPISNSFVILLTNHQYSYQIKLKIYCCNSAYLNSGPLQLSRSLSAAQERTELCVWLNQSNKSSRGPSNYVTIIGK